VRPGADFSSFRYHDVGRPGHILRLAGHRPSGTWADAAWLIAKRDAHVEEGLADRQAGRPRRWGEARRGTRRRRGRSSKP